MTIRSLRRSRAGAMAACAGALLLGPTAAAELPTLYHSPGDTGVDPGELVPTLPNAGTRTVFLYLDPGPTPAINGPHVCQVGSVIGTCGVHFRIRVHGGLSIAGFTPEVGVVRSRNTGTELTAAIVTTADPIGSGPKRIGTLEISGAGGSGELEMLETVDANLDLQTGGQRELFFVPEPDGGLLIVVGVAGLAALQRLRGALRRRR